MFTADATKSYSTAADYELRFSQYSLQVTDIGKPYEDTTVCDHARLQYFSVSTGVFHYSYNKVTGERWYNYDGSLTSRLNDNGVCPHIIINKICT